MLLPAGLTRGRPGSALVLPLCPQGAPPHRRPTLEYFCTQQGLGTSCTCSSALDVRPEGVGEGTRVPRGGGPREGHQGQKGESFPSRGRAKARGGAPLPIHGQPREETGGSPTEAPNPPPRTTAAGVPVQGRGAHVHGLQPDPAPRGGGPGARRRRRVPGVPAAEGVTSPSRGGASRQGPPGAQASLSSRPSFPWQV